MSPGKTTKKTTTKKSAAKKSAGATKSSGWSDVEKAAMKDHARELKAEARRGRNREAGERDLLAAIAEMKDPDRGMAQRIHAIVAEAAPMLAPKTWYGMPAWANAEGKVVCFFQAAAKFKARYATFGFSDSAAVDDGDMWPTSFALTKLTPAGEKQIAALLRRAAS
jgi:uncharacterized protein YdhG (YjbR/CyaY superfamily)